MIEGSVTRTGYSILITEAFTDGPADGSATEPTRPVTTSQHERAFADGDEARRAYFQLSHALSTFGHVPGYQDIVDRWLELTAHGALGQQQVELKIAGDALLKALQHELGRR